MRAPAGDRWTGQSISLLCLAAVALAPAVGCVGAPKILPPRTPPAAVPPPVPLPASPIPTKQGRVVIFTTDGPMRVVAEAPPQFAASSEQARAGDLCVSPCVVDMPLGHYKLYLSGLQPGVPAGDVDDLRVNPGVNYYLRAPGRFEHPRWIPAGSVLAGIVGVLVVSGGLALMLGRDGGDSATLGLLVFGAGTGILIGAGAYTYDAQRGSLQKGATTQWSLPPR